MILSGTSAAKRHAMHTILVPFDGSENALRALEETIALFPPKALYVRLLNVQEPVHGSEVLLKDTLHDMRAIEKEREETGMRVLAPARALLDKAAIMYEANVRTGTPAEIIASCAKEFHCEMIVMGTRGQSAIKKLVMGSVASKLVQLAAVAVMLVK